MLPTRALWVIKYCSGSSGSSHRNGDSGGKDGELHAQRSGRPAGGVVSHSKPASSKPAATTALGALELGEGRLLWEPGGWAGWGMAWGLGGWAEEQLHPLDWGQDQTWRGGGDRKDR